MMTAPDDARDPIEQILSNARVPLATYRLQFNRDFTFRQGTEIAEYLHDLGISDCYSSPIFNAGPQSTHGYDICDFNQLNAQLGTSADFDQFTSRLRQFELGLMLDMVPNHMRADSSNSWWTDVLEQGRLSRFASYFDIDWQPTGSDLHDKILLSVLEDHYAKVLEAGKLQLAVQAGHFWIRYCDGKFPLAPRAYLLILRELSDNLSELTADDAAGLGSWIREVE